MHNTASADRPPRRGQRRKLEGREYQIVRAHIQILHAFFGATATAQREDGHLPPLGAHQLQNVRGFHARQIQIQNH
jgi:hypothetical protein